MPEDEFSVNVEYKTVSLEDGGIGILATHPSDGVDSEVIAVESVGVIAGYIMLIENGHDLDRMEVKLVHQRYEHEMAYYTVEREWADDYINGGITEDELISLVADTVREA